MFITETHIIDPAPDQVLGLRQMHGRLQLWMFCLHVQPSQAVLPLDLDNAATLQLNPRTAPHALIKVTELDSITLQDTRGNLRRSVKHCNEKFLFCSTMQSPWEHLRLTRTRQGQVNVYSSL